MSEPRMKARVSQLHKTEAEWSKLKSWVPEAGEIIVYDPDSQHNYARVKIGDGKRDLQSLTFLIDSAINTYMQKQRHSEVLDGGRVSDYEE